MTINQYKAEIIRTLREFPPTREGQIELYRMAYPKARTVRGGKRLENCSDEQIRSVAGRIYNEAWASLRLENRSSFIKTAGEDYQQRLLEQLNLPSEEQENYTLSDLEAMMGID